MNQKPPNIVLILDDQHRYDWLGLWRRSPARTPNLDRLAREGVWHRHAYSTCPLCMPARCSLATGLYGHQTGMTANVGRWPLTLPTVYQALQKAGYHTAAIGKIHIYEGIPEKADLTTLDETTRRYGFDEVWEVAGKSMAFYIDCHYTHYLREKGLLERYREDGAARGGDEPGDDHPFIFDAADYVDILVGDRAADWIRNYDGSRPFFLQAGLCCPHPPYDPPAEFAQPYRPEDMPLPIDCDDPHKWAVRRALYCGMIALVDAQVGRIRQALEDKGILDDTLVLFVADHGEMLGDHDKAGKCWPHDPSIRVPLIARCPGLIMPGTVSDALVELIDLPATFVEVAGGAVPQALPSSPGRSLVSHWDRPTRGHREYIYSEDGGQFHPAFQMVRTPAWKYAYLPGEGSELLFNIEDCPSESVNVADHPRHFAVKDELKTRLLAHLAETPAPLRD